MDDIDFFPDLSVVEHLDLMARAHAQPDAQDIVDVVLDEVGLMEVSGQLPSTLSSGQRRVSTSTACSGSATSSSPRRRPAAGPPRQPRPGPRGAGVRPRGAAGPRERDRPR